MRVPVRIERETHLASYLGQSRSSRPENSPSYLAILPRKMNAFSFIKPLCFPLCSTPAGEETSKEVVATKEETNGHAKNGEDKNGDHKNGNSKNGDSNGAEKDEEKKVEEEKEVR